MKQKIKICIYSCNEFSDANSIVSAKFHFNRHGKMLIVDNNTMYKRNGNGMTWCDDRASLWRHRRHRHPYEL